MNELTQRMGAGEHISPKTEAEKNCFQFSMILMPSPARCMAQLQVRNTCVVKYGPLSIILVLLLVCQNPVAGARFFDFMVCTFLEDVLGICADKQEGFYGHTSSYYGMVEQQGRLTLHLHMLFWIVGNMNPEDLRVKILEESSVWHQNLISWLERCHSGNFLSGTHAEVSSYAEQLKENQDYLDLTQTLLVPPPPPCQTHPEVDDGPKDCNQCNALLQWNVTYCTIVDNLLLHSNVHNCN